MSKENKLVEKDNNVPSVNLDNNLYELVSLVNDSVQTYKRVSPNYKTIIEKLTKDLSSEEQLDNLDIDHMFKLLEISTKNFLAPLETLTKLVQAVSTLRERMMTETESERLGKVVDMLEKERKVNTIDGPNILEAIVVNSKEK